MIQQTRTIRGSLWQAPRRIVPLRIDCHHDCMIGIDRLSRHTLAALRRRGANGVWPLILRRSQVGPLFYLGHAERALAVRQSKPAGAEERNSCRSPNRVSPVLNRAHRRFGASRVSEHRSKGTGQTPPSKRCRTPSADPYTRLGPALQRRAAQPQPKSAHTHLP